MGWSKVDESWWCLGGWIQEDPKQADRKRGWEDLVTCQRSKAVITYRARIHFWLSDESYLPLYQRNAPRMSDVESRYCGRRQRPGRPPPSKYRGIEVELRKTSRTTYVWRASRVPTSSFSLASRCYGHPGYSEPAEPGQGWLRSEKWGQDPQWVSQKRWTTSVTLPHTPRPHVPRFCSTVPSKAPRKELKAPWG